MVFHIRSITYGLEAIAGSQPVEELGSGGFTGNHCLHFARVGLLETETGVSRCGSGSAASPEVVAPQQGSWRVVCCHKRQISLDGVAAGPPITGKRRFLVV